MLNVYKLVFQSNTIKENPTKWQKVTKGIIIYCYYYNKWNLDVLEDIKENLRNTHFYLYLEARAKQIYPANRKGNN